MQNPSKKLAINRSWLIAGGAIVLAVAWVIAIDRYADSDPDTTGAGLSDTAQTEPDDLRSPAAPASTVGPWENATNAAKREETLSLIQELQQRKAALDGLAPDMWATDALAAIAALTARGDEAYKSADYAGAREIFGQALSAINTAIERGPIVAEEAKKRGHDALAAGDFTDALEAFGIAAAIDPTDAEAAAGLTTASVRDEVDAMMVRGEFALKTSDFAGARAQFKQAAQLDPTDPRAREALTRTGRLEKSSRLARLTRQGYEAVEAGKFERAIDRFSAALVLSPQSSDARQGLKLAERRLKSSRLESLRARGTDAENREDWQEAISAYQAALKLDASKSFALNGLARAQRYLAFEQEIAGYVAQPFRLTSGAVAQAAGALVLEMSQIAGLPPGLSAKSADLERLLGQMSAVVDVTISSDGQSDVSVQRFEKLGKFKQRTIGLKYGKYVLTARRIGYVDKRMELEIPVGSQPLSLTLYCDERI